MLSKSKLKMLLILAALVLAPIQVRAATVTTFSDTLSDSRPSLAVDHTISWDVVDAGGFVAGDSFAITFASGFDTSAITEDDVDIEDDGVDITTAADCSGSDVASVAMANDVLTVTACEGDGANITGILTVKIGTNAAESGTGANQITSPAAGSYTVSMAGTGYTDSGEIQVAVIPGVTTSLAVSASLSVTVAGLASSEAVNGATTTIDASSDATSIPFGTMVVNTAKVAGQTVTVSTNAAEGYTTAIRWFGTGTNDGLTSGSNNIDGFTNDTATNADPKAWADSTNPSGTAANTNTGWYGYTTNDATLGTGTADRFTSSGGNKWAPFSATPAEIAYDNAPVNAQATSIGYRVEVNALQPQGSYTGVTEYITTASF